MKTPDRPLVVILDADNTLWDTHAIFEAGHSAAITAVSSGDTEQISVAALRRVDRALARQLGAFEYDFEFLGRALVLLSARETEAEAVRKAVEEPSQLASTQLKIARTAALALRHELDTAIPGLLPYARTLLEWLAASRADSTTRIVSFLLSEGNPQRVQRIIRHYEPNSTGRFFDDVILVPDKDAATFSRIAGRGGNLVGSNDPIVVVIGDSLKRDIGPGNRIGAITIYKPAGFHGNESVRNAELRPDYEVADLDEARRVLVDLAQSKVPAPVSRTDRV